jgi:two-component system cell cycle sensor histidine kinase/response regulator CckA
MRMNLRLKINGAILITFFVIVLIFMAIYRPYQNQRLNMITKNVEGVINLIVERDREPLANDIYQGLTDAIKLRLDQMLEVTDLLLISVYDKSGKLLASDGLHNPDTLELSGAEIGRINHDKEIRHENWHGQYTIIYTREIQIIGETIGFIRIYSTMEGVKKEQRVSYIILGGMLASILITMLVLLNFFISRTIIRPIASLSEAMDRMQSGTIEEHVFTGGNDEIGDLSGAFNRMSWALSTSYHEVDSQRKELQGIRNYLSNIINSMPSMLIGIDPDMKITQWNIQAEKRTGLPAESVNSKILPDVLPQLAAEIDKVKAAMRDRATRRSENVTFELHDKEAFMDITIYPLIADGVEGAVIRLDDVTERKKIEDALFDSQEKYRLVVDNANDAIIILQDGIIKFANPRAAEASGYPLDELINKDFLELIAQEDKEMTSKNYRARIAGQAAPQNYLFRIINKKGGHVWVDLHVVMITWEGQLATLNFMKDVTRQKTIEDQLQQAQKMEAIGTLAGGIAHDFNNLLQAIQGYTQLLLLNKQKNSSSERELEEILGAARRGGELTRQLLTFSRKVESNMRPLDINTEISKIEKLLSRTIPKMIEIQLNLSEDLYTVNADPGQIEQVIMNLALNARDAMKEGGKVVVETENVILNREYCETHLIEKPGEYVLISISDTGHGMNKETLEHIFEPFFTTKKVGEGTGLGLAMVYGIVMNHKGAINCYSVPGKGTTFRIYLPAIESFKESAVPDAVEPPRTGTETILLVDDDEAIRDIGTQILERFGYTVIVAPDGDKALEIYRNEQARINVVILDLIMPGMGGGKCLEEVLKMNPQARVIIASGYFVNGGEGAHLKIGATGFIKKPYVLESMLHEIRRVIEKS